MAGLSTHLTNHLSPLKRTLWGHTFKSVYNSTAGKNYLFLSLFSRHTNMGFIFILKHTVAVYTTSIQTMKLATQRGININNTDAISVCIILKLQIFSQTACLARKKWSLDAAAN